MITIILYIFSPENVRARNDIFYLQPERSCVPDSPVWFSTSDLNQQQMEKMLQRVLMVQEVQEQMLDDNVIKGKICPKNIALIHTKYCMFYIPTLQNF